MSLSSYTKDEADEYFYHPKKTEVTDETTTSAVDEQKLTPYHEIGKIYGHDTFCLEFNLNVYAPKDRIYGIEPGTCADDSFPYGKGLIDDNLMVWPISVTLWLENENGDYNK